LPTDCVVSAGALVPVVDVAVDPDPSQEFRFDAGLIVMPAASKRSLAARAYTDRTPNTSLRRGSVTQ
jgi:hypothetical protein